MGKIKMSVTQTARCVTVLQTLEQFISKYKKEKNSKVLEPFKALLKDSVSPLFQALDPTKENKPLAFMHQGMTQLYVKPDGTFVLGEPADLPSELIPEVKEKLKTLKLPIPQGIPVEMFSLKMMDFQLEDFESRGLEFVDVAGAFQELIEAMMTRYSTATQPSAMA